LSFSDFPNYYLTARLVREHFDTSRIYDWIWLQRQKDHRAIDQRIVGMVPITPLSTLVIYPLTSMSALAAKRCWLIANMGLLFATLLLFRSLTTLPWRHVLLIAALSAPLRANFLLGQYYVLLLFLLTTACWFYLRQKHFMAGILVGIAAGLKIFPIVYLLIFLRKNDWGALAGGVIASLGSLAVSVLLFGWELNRMYLVQVLPATLRGEGLAPYNLQAASLSTLLHRLFIYEPLLNPHPAFNTPWVFAVIHPLLQMAMIAAVILLAIPGDHSAGRVRLEWASTLLASLAISTSPASYLFTLLMLPTVLIWESLREQGRDRWAAVLLLLYVAAGVLGGRSDGGEGWAALLAVPRLYALIMFAAFSYVVLFRLYSHEQSSRDRTRWAIALLAILTLNIGVGLRHQKNLYEDYRWRITEPIETLMAAYPSIQGDATRFVALLSDGYHSAIVRDNSVRFDNPQDKDVLAVTASSNESWTEQVDYRSTIRSSIAGREAIEQAESPMASNSGRWLTFLREDHGRASIWSHALDRTDNLDRRITPPDLNVLEMSILPDGHLVFAADVAGHPTLFLANHSGSIASLGIVDARYPSASPDGHRLAYSKLHNGTWNLWLRDLTNGNTTRLTYAECNDTQPIWMQDSKTLIYASDCGRGLWLSALCKRRVIP
jgi:hypothetical protein